MSDRDFHRPRRLNVPMPAGARLLLLLSALGAVLAVPAAAHALTVGIADNKPDMYFDPRFERSGVSHARISIGWDALSNPWESAQVDTWLRAAHAANVTPLVSFGHSRTDRRSLPTPERFLFEFRRFRARYPWVTEFATWNEANHCGEPTCHRPRLVAAYYRKLRAECRECRILAAEVLDMPNMVRWVRSFRRAARHEPRYWGLHNYIDANRRRTTGTRRMLQAVRGQVWFTETGGIVWRRNRGKVPFPESPSHAAAATRFLFQRLVPLSRRVTRVYIYHWNLDGPPTTWDSALIGPDGELRPAYTIVHHELNEQTRRRAARAARRRATAPAVSAVPGPVAGA